IHGVPFDETPPVAQKPAKKKAAEAKPPIKKGAPAAGKPDDQPPEEPADDPENSAKSAPKKKAWTVDEGEPMPPAKKETDLTKPPAAAKV
ncbi:MAG TPA: hypothetical protein VNC50_10425, partial [Planctomycetia bacterium]|nr:hypothetical protein [Planctomycetia bacterium]